MDLKHVTPEQIVIQHDPKHPRYDDRVKEKLDPDLVASVELLGVKKPTFVFLNADGNYEHIDGQNRTRALIEVNKVRAKHTKEYPEGAPPWSLPVLVMPYTEEDYEEIMALRALGNGGAKQTSPGQKARLALQLEEAGLPVEAIAAHFVVGEGAIGRWLKLAKNGSGQLLKAVDEGEVPVNLAAKVANLPPEEQIAKLQAATKDGEIDPEKLDASTKRAPTRDGSRRPDKQRGGEIKPKTMALKRLVQVIDAKIKEGSAPAGSQYAADALFFAATGKASENLAALLSIAAEVPSVVKKSKSKKPSAQPVAAPTAQA